MRRPRYARCQLLGPAAGDAAALHGRCVALRGCAAAAVSAHLHLPCCRPQSARPRSQRRAASAAAKKLRVEDEDEDEGAGEGSDAGDATEEASGE